MPEDGEPLYGVGLRGPAGAEGNMTPMPRDRLFAAAVIGATAIGLALRLQHVGTESLWSDEVAQLQFTERSLRSFLSDGWQRADPPLNELLAWVWNNGLRRWVEQFATAEAAIRLPVVIFGTLAIPAVGFAARGAFGPRSGGLAALALATNPYHIRYSQDARMYPLTVLLSTIAIGYLVRTLREGRRRDACASGAFLAAATYTHFYAFFSLIAALAATLAALTASARPSSPPEGPVDRRRLRVLLQGEILGAMLVLPFLIALGVRVWFSGGSNVAARPWLTSRGVPGLRTAWLAAQTYASDRLFAVVPAAAPGSLDAWIVTAGLVGLGGALVAGVFAVRDDEPKAIRLHLVALALVPPLIVFALSRLRPIYHPRYLIAILPALVLLCVRARPWPLAAALLALPIAMGLGVEPRYHRLLETPDYRAAAQLIADRCTEDDLLQGAATHRRPLQFYLERAGGKCKRYIVSTPDTIPGSHSSRIFLIETVPRRAAAVQRIDEVEETPITGGAKHELLFRDQSDPMLRLWLNAP
jgi:hypothetical protein